MFHVKIDVASLRYGNKGVDVHVAVLPFIQLPVDASDASPGYNLADGMDATLAREPIAWLAGSNHRMPT